MAIVPDRPGGIRLYCHDVLKARRENQYEDYDEDEDDDDDTDYRRRRDDGVRVM